MFRPVRTIAPTAAPLTLADVKAHLDYDDDDRDALIAALIEAAVSYLDGYAGILGRALMPQTWRQDFSGFGAWLRIPLLPIATVSSVKYVDTDDVEQTIDNGNYTLLTDATGPWISFHSDYTVPSVSSIVEPSVSVTYVAGYADAAAVPAAIKQAMLLMIRHWFDNPSAVVIGVTAQAVPMAADALLAPWRRFV